MALASPLAEAFLQASGWIWYEKTVYEKQTHSNFGSPNISGIGRVLNKRSGADDRGRSRAVRSAQRSDGDRPGADAGRGAELFPAEQWADGVSTTGWSVV